MEKGGNQTEGKEEEEEEEEGVKMTKSAREGGRVLLSLSLSPLLTNQLSSSLFNASRWKNCSSCRKPLFPRGKDGKEPHIAEPRRLLTADIP